MAAAVPSVLSIPKLKLETTFEEPLGLNSDGTAAVPESYTKVGWYKNGPTPGELGPAVILGHVDSFEGPAVFFSLGQLEVGDDIFVTREDGSTAHFVVSEVERNQQSEFPTVKVYGNLNYAGLRLITCTGTFVKGEQRYTHNLIVYAKLVE
jgi:LPXTG-site transpeptidase (sortase) family protein